MKTKNHQDNHNHTNYSNNMNNESSDRSLRLSSAFFRSESACSNEERHRFQVCSKTTKFGVFGLGFRGLGDIEFRI